MRNQIYNVGDARRDLPRLVREASAGAGPFRIGRRGSAGAVLVNAEDYDTLRERSRASVPKGSWNALRFELVGTPAELERDLAAVRAELRASLERRLDRYTDLAPRPRPPRRRRTPSKP
jgi:prevent-host-death family protein